MIGSILTNGSRFSSLLVSFLLWFCAFHKHANSKVQKRPSQIEFLAAVNHNYDQKQRTLKNRNTQNGSKSTNSKQKPWPFEPVKQCKVKFCFLRGPLRWSAAKNAIVSWVLNFRIRMFVKSAVSHRFHSPTFHLTLEVLRVTKHNFLLTITIDRQWERLGKSI